MRQVTSGLRQILGVLLVLVAGVSSCAKTNAPRDATAIGNTPAPVPVAANPEPPAEVQVALLDPALLTAIEARGYGLGELVSGTQALTTRELSRLPEFQSIFQILRADVRAVKREQPLAKVTSVFGFRLFDERWFDSSEMSFELTGVFNRLDRRVFYSASCGAYDFPNGHRVA